MSYLADQSGGRIYNRNWDLADVLAEVRKP
jgi:hypothetical protein